MEVFSGGIPVVEVAERYGGFSQKRTGLAASLPSGGLPGLAGPITACITIPSSWPLTSRLGCASCD
jgi:ABC-type uncharacterized transport system permease subunit